MAESSSIEWTDATWNPVTGCSVVSPGCTNCYAMKLAGGRLQHHPSRAGLTTPSKAGPVWNGQVRLNPGMLTDPLRWTRPRRIFVCAHGDLFHEAVPDAWIDQVFAVMALCPQHTFQVLTKRPERMRAWFEERWQGTPAQRLEFPDGTFLDIEAGGPTGRRSQVEAACEPFLQQFGLADPDKPDLWTEDDSCKAMQWRWPLPNVWLGTSAEDQVRAEERIPELLKTPAAVRFLSAEPLLGPIDLAGMLWSDDVGITHKGVLPDKGEPDDFAYWVKHAGIRWVIAGGESGPGARPMHPSWARQIRDDCAAADIPFFFKQWGAWAPGENAGPIKGPQTCASWDDDHFGIERLTESQANSFTCEDEPALWLVGKKAAGRRLDGIEHNGMPEAG